MQDALRTSFESLLVPAFEQACKTMFEQIDGAFQKGMSEHSTAIQHQVESSHSPLALTLKVSSGPTFDILVRQITRTSVDGYSFVSSHLLRNDFCIFLSLTPRKSSILHHPSPRVFHRSYLMAIASYWHLLLLGMPWHIIPVLCSPLMVLWVDPRRWLQTTFCLQ
jgi:hypothetical protein